VAVRWLKRDRPAAEAWLQKQDLTPDERKKLLGGMPPAVPAAEHPAPAQAPAHA
jgi:hypothetical protein